MADNVVGFAPCDKGILNDSIAADFLIKNKKHEVFFRSTEAVFSGNLEAFLAAAILPCMKTGGGKIMANGHVSLYDTILRKKVSNKIQEVASFFNKNIIEIETNLRDFLSAYVKWGPLVMEQFLPPSAIYCLVQ